jgi:hypothetical protein
VALPYDHEETPNLFILNPPSASQALLAARILGAFGGAHNSTERSIEVQAGVAGFTSAAM